MMYYLSLWTLVLSHLKIGSIRYPIVTGAGTEIRRQLLRCVESRRKGPFTESIPSSQQAAVQSQQVDAPLSGLNSQLKNPFVIPGIRNLQIESQLNPSYNFQNFLEGDSNRLARSAGIAVANKPGGTSFNPLLIFAEHLMLVTIGR